MPPNLTNLIYARVNLIIQYVNRHVAWRVISLNPRPITASALHTAHRRRGATIQMDSNSCRSAHAVHHAVVASDPVDTTSSGYASFHAMIPPVRMYALDSVTPCLSSSAAYHPAVRVPRPLELLQWKMILGMLRRVWCQRTGLVHFRVSPGKRQRERGKVPRRRARCARCARCARSLGPSRGASS